MQLKNLLQKLSFCPSNISTLVYLIISITLQRKQIDFFYEMKSAHDNICINTYFLKSQRDQYHNML